MKEERSFVINKTQIGTIKITYSDTNIYSIELYDFSLNKLNTIDKDRIEIAGYNEFVVERISGEDSEISDRALYQLYEYFVGKRKIFDFPYELIGTDFQKKVWNKLTEIPYGSLVSYLYIAKAIDNPSASRAVGNAVGKNPLLIVVPCHRVIKKDGNMGGFSSGIQLKKYLIELEKGRRR
ncbi:MAG: methylated-DNA--[protein]-cysteine S-methyltransferase [Clostridiales bacterium]|nr:methylated-DNA--[protein]-cysteine S-methyltransferase [Clostridiales bacterium]